MTALGLGLGLGVGLSIFLLFTAIVIGRFLWKVRRVLKLQAELSRHPEYADPDLASHESDAGIARLGLPTRYSYLDLNYATRGFSPRELLGAGGFGSVYRGFLPPGDTVVAVKKLSESSRQGEREFVAEVSTIGRVRHKNLVQLKGFCYESGRMLLVYEHMPNGSLDKALFPSAGGTVLGWPQRYRVVKGVAAGLAYLHEGWEKRVLHRDVKPSNVLLDQDFEPRIADFGLARLVEHTKTWQTMTMAGTLGYLAPEIHYTGKPTDKADVYSFGILLLVVACGRQPMDKRLQNEQESMLLNWVWRMQETGNLIEAADPRLAGEFDENEMRRVLQLGLICCFPDPETRPLMRLCEQILHGDASIPGLPSSKPALYYPVNFNVDIRDDLSFARGPSSTSTSVSGSTAAPQSDYTSSEISSSQARSSANSASFGQPNPLLTLSNSAKITKREDAMRNPVLLPIKYSSFKEIPVNAQPASASKSV